jgi:hypothetical protein
MKYDQAIKFFGGPEENITLAANKSGFTRASWHNWKRSKGPIPYQSQCVLNNKSGGKLKVDK